MKETLTQKFIKEIAKIKSPEVFLGVARHNHKTSSILLIQIIYINFIIYFLNLLRQKKIYKIH